MFNIPMNSTGATNLGGGQQTQQNMMPQQYATPQINQGAGVVLKKGQKISLTQMNPNLSIVEVGLGWDINNNQIVDLDAEAFLLGANDRALGDDWFVFYNQQVSPDGAVRHSGDNRTGNGDGDDEIISINLQQLNPAVSKVVFVITICEALENGQRFNMVQNAYVRVTDKSTGAELMKFNLTDYYNNVISMMVGELYLKDGQWRFNAIGNGTGDDLVGLCNRYGVNVVG